MHCEYQNLVFKKEFATNSLFFFNDKIVES